MLQSLHTSQWLTRLYNKVYLTKWWIAEKWNKYTYKSIKAMALKQKYVKQINPLAKGP